MLQRAASNAYSWWCASHIRTNQSKWLNNDLQEMEGRVQAMLKIIEEDADSFAKRAEMYYRRRPELINFVEETYRAYRALADKFDHVSGELHKANNALATAFPDVQFPMEDEDDDNSEGFASGNLKPPIHRSQISLPKPPPEGPQVNLLPSKRSGKKPAIKEPEASREFSQISEDKAKEAIDKLQKTILVLQTEKEFVKSSYEIGLSKYWEIEKAITVMQEEVCSLQDEFSGISVIEDDEARALMAATALKSCKDSLVNLQEHQKRSMEETLVESERIRTAKEKLRGLKDECGEVDEIPMGTSAPSTTTEEESCGLQQETVELQSICEQVRNHLEISSQTSVVDLAEKIDELVNKLLNLEFTVLSHNAQLQNLRSETDDIQKHLRNLEEMKVSSVNNSHSLNDNDKLTQSEKSKPCGDFKDSCVSAKSKSPKQAYNTGPSPLQEDICLPIVELQKHNEETRTMSVQDVNDIFEDKSPHSEGKDDCVESQPISQLKNCSGSLEPEEPENEVAEKAITQGNHGNRLSVGSITQEDDIPNLLQLLSDGIEGKEKILLAEYTNILRSYKETKRKLLEIEKQNQENFGDTMSEVRELKNANAMKDGEIRSLRQILSSLQQTSDSKLQNSEILGGLNLEGTTEQGSSTTKQEDAEEDTIPYQVEESEATSAIEGKFRKDIDALLDENLEFWLRFSTSFHQIQRFRSEFQTLQSDIEKLKESKKHEGSTGKSEPNTEDNKLRELKSELQVWVEQNAMLRKELQTRFSSLCNIQEEISGVSNASPDGGVQFTPFQAAKFQGEVLNMKQENNKVADELQAGLDHVKGLQGEVEKTLSSLSNKFELSSSQKTHHSRSTAKNFSNKNKGVPLKNFLYGGKSKKPSIFS